MEKEFNSKSFLSQNKIKKVLSVLLIAVGVISFIMAIVVTPEPDYSEETTANTCFASVLYDSGR